jgi:peptidoglycan/xylan/chitin deacetylase (PgdA/CDA1 family)
VLCYHAVSATWPHLLSVSPADLERQLESVLARGYRPVGAAEAARGEGRLVHVTFDDGFASVLDALPVLERLRMRATVFVCSSYADDGRPFRIRELREEIEARPDELRTMTWDDLRGLADRGIEIGAHTVSHPRLPFLPQPEVERELRESKERIEAEIGRPCRHVAYPYGEHDAHVRRAAEAAGFEAAFGQDPRPASWSDRYQIPRVPVWRGEGPRLIAFKRSGPGRSAPMMALRRARGRLAH